MGSQLTTMIFTMVVKILYVSHCFHELHTPVLLLVFVNHGKSHIQVFSLEVVPSLHGLKKQLLQIRDIILHPLCDSWLYIHVFHWTVKKLCLRNMSHRDHMIHVFCVHNTLAASLVKTRTQLLFFWFCQPQGKSGTSTATWLDAAILQALIMNRSSNRLSLVFHNQCEQCKHLPLFTLSPISISIS